MDYLVFIWLGIAYKSSCSPLWKSVLLQAHGLPHGGIITQPDRLLLPIF